MRFAEFLELVVRSLTEMLARLAKLVRACLHVHPLAADGCTADREPQRGHARHAAPPALAVPG